jgi:hypothetical protein
VEEMIRRHILYASLRGLRNISENIFGGDWVANLDGTFEFDENDTWNDSKEIYKNTHLNK